MILPGRSGASSVTSARRIGAPASAVPRPAITSWSVSATTGCTSAPFEYPRRARPPVSNRSHRMAAHLILSPMRLARVQLLVTCLVDRFFPGTGDSVVTLLEKAGVTVTVPAAQICCGHPAFIAGYDAEARALARHTIDILPAPHAPLAVPV